MTFTLCAMEGMLSFFSVTSWDFSLLLTSRDRESERQASNGSRINFTLCSRCDNNHTRVCSGPDG